MALIDEVRTTLNSLSNGGWAELFAHHGLNIGAANLRQQLLKPLSNIDRTAPGFEDFAADGERGIEPGSPSHSLLYHALASPNVQLQPDGSPLTKFPTLKQLDQVENLVFGIQRPSLAQVREQVQNSELSVVVFACDYRPAQSTAHGRHADLMFSRTGVARVGTSDEEYVGRLRGFVSFVDGEAQGVRVLPARYSAYLAVRRSGSERDGRPMRFQQNDDNRQFWVPVHKLFEGNECLSGIGSALELKFTPIHVNEKLRRIHLNLQNEHGLDTGVSASNLDRPPFRIRSGIARNGPTSKYPKGVVVPVPHDALVEKATFNGQPAKFPVPRNLGGISSSILLARDKSAPEFVHARHEVLADGSISDLNRFANVSDRVNQGGYDAQHYLDFSADGVLSVECPQLEDRPEIRGFESAYSLVAAPDFYPLVDQRELTEWTESLTSAVPGISRNDIWGIQPEPLCDDRFPANLQFPDFDFDSRETGVTAVIGMAGRVSGGTVTSRPRDPMRQSHLPDDAAGFFDPGWDIATTRDPDTGLEHLAAFGLGSPFPEDAKLCAAITAFWPAVAPDIARSIEPLSPGRRMRTVSPLTDEEIGVGGTGIPWDGVEPLRIVNTGGDEELDYAAFSQTDYVQQALDNNLSVSIVGRLSAEDYQNRVLAMTLLYKGFAQASQSQVAAVRQVVTGHDENNSLLYSVTEVPTGDATLIEAQIQGGFQFIGPVFGVKAASLRGLSFRSVSNRRVRIPMRRKIEIFVSPRIRFILLRRAAGPWHAVQAV